MWRRMISEWRHLILCDVKTIDFYNLIGSWQCYDDVTAKVISSLVKYEKVMSSLVKYLTVDDIKTVSLKNNSKFKLNNS